MGIPARKGDRHVVVPPLDGLHPSIYQRRVQSLPVLWFRDVQSCPELGEQGLLGL